MQLKLTLEEIIKESDGIFVCTVVTQGCRLGPNGRMIFTDVQLAVTEWIGGRVAKPASTGGGDTLLLSFAGGQHGEMACKVSDVPKLKTGETYLIFAKLDGRQYASPIIGAYQGLFKVHRDNSSGRQFATTTGDRAIMGVSEKDLMLSPPVEEVVSGVGKLKQRKGPPPNLHNVAPVAVDGNPAHKAKISAVRPPAAAPSKLMPLDQFSQEIRNRLRRLHEGDSKK